MTSEIGQHRNIVDRGRHRARKSKSPSSFAHATAKDTGTRIAPAIITMANTPSLTSANTANPPEKEPCRTVDPAGPGTTRRPSACPPETNYPQ